MSIHLVLGGVRSGKSRFAEQCCEQLSAQGRPVVYVATATVREDVEMQSRISRHRERRPDHWQTLEEPLSLAASLAAIRDDQSIVLVDCLTLWVTNLLLLENEPRMEQEIADLLAFLKQTDQDVLMVSNEVGLGVLPMGDLTRRYCDVAGDLHQDIAALADEVTLVVAGLPQTLKASNL